MLNQLKYELQILIKRDKFAKVLLIETCLLVIYCIFSVMNKNSSIYGSIYDFYFLLNHNHTTISYCLILIVPILSTLAHGDVGYQEDTMKYMVMSRCSNTKYKHSRSIMVFLVGFFNILYILEIIYVLQYCALDVDLTYYYTGNNGVLQYLIPTHVVPFFSFLYKHPIMYFQMYILIISMFGGFSALLSYELDQLFHNPTTMYINGFLVVLSISLIMHFVGNYQMWSYFYLLSPNIWGIPNNLFVFVGWIIWILIFFFLIMIIRQVKKKIEL